MQNEPSNIKSSYKISAKSLQKMSRYKSIDRLVNENNVAYVGTQSKFTIKESNLDTFYAVEKGYENRLDLISYKFYNTPFLWWAIASMNNIQNPLEIEAGIVLRIPCVSSIYAIGGVLA